MTRADSGTGGPDPEAFETFFHRHVGEVLTAVARRVADPEVIADLVAEVFATIHTTGRPGAPARGWLARTVTVLVAGHPHRALEAPSGPRVSGRRLLTEADVAELRALTGRESGHRALAAEIAGRPARHRAALELAILDGLPPAEIAVVLGLRPSTVRRRLRRGPAGGSRPARAELPDFTGRLLRELVAR